MSLVIRNLSVTYDTAPILDRVDFSVSTGEHFAIMGPSGSGKSTLLRAIAGLTPVGSGTITIDNTDTVNTPAHRRPVGLMFQDYALFPHMTVLENIGYGLRMSGIAIEERNRRSGELLDLVGLGGLADRKPATLSGGEQQRVALARTLAPSPSIVLLDEPLGSLDTSLKESLLVETRAILDAVSATSIYVTHDRDEAFTFCDRMALLDQGTLVRVGTPDEIWHDPQSEFVARSIGQTNLVPLREIDEARSGLAFVPQEAIRVHSGGRHVGITTASRFTDGAHVAQVQVEPEGFVMEVRTDSDMSKHSELRFDIDPTAVIVVSADQL